MSHDETFFIGELAERSGVSREAIRYYERVGVLPDPERTMSGYRLYGTDDVERLDFVAQAQGLGLSLDEISEVLEIVDEGRQPCVHVRTTLEERLAETRRRIHELRSLEDRLERVLARSEAAISESDRGCRCHIIEDAPDGTGSPKPG